ncbi:hypothetical protein JW916_08525 [Candidatus Sumerlaeota bacterium]|nr:hypothetical protein [Candidatus Sumerlaeota bacterium]
MRKTQVGVGLLLVFCGLIAAIKVLSSRSPSEERSQEIQTADKEGRDKESAPSAEKTPAVLIDLGLGDVHLPVKESVETELHIRGLRESDARVLARFDVPRDEVVSSTTEKILHHYTQVPTLGFTRLYGDPNVGIERMLRATNFLAELLSREDIAEAAISLFDRYPVSPTSISDSAVRENYRGIESVEMTPDLASLRECVQDPKNTEKLKVTIISMDLEELDHLLSHPRVFEKLRGHEAELLLCMARRYERIGDVVGRFEQIAFDDYGAVLSSTISLSLALSQGVNEELHRDLLVAQEPPLDPNDPLGRFFQSLKQYLGKTRGVRKVPVETGALH